jgi:Caspase domain
VTAARRLVWAAVLLVLGGCAAATTGPALQAPGPPAGSGGAPLAERPTWSLGDRWIRTDGLWELIRIEPDHYVFSARTDEELHFSRELVIARYKHYGNTELEFEPLPKLAWPLQVGSRGVATGRYKPRFGVGYDADFQWSVVAWEEVTVPAGTFKAYRIVYRIAPRLAANFARPDWRSAPPSTLTLTYWYAPEIRQFVKADGDSWIVRFELVAVDPGESEPLTVRVREPEDHSTVLAGSDPTLAGHASGGKGVVRIDVTVNGQTVATESPKGEPRRSVPLNVALPLRDGKNVIIVTATDPVGTKVQEARTVFYTAPPAVPLPAPGAVGRVGQERIRLLVPLPAGKPVGVISVAVNDVVADSVLSANARDGNVEAVLKLAEGENHIRIRYEVFNEGQIVEERTIVFDPAAGAPVQLAGPTVPSAEHTLAPASAPSEARAAEEERKRAEEQRLAEARKRAAEQRLAEDQQKRAEEQRVAEEQRKRAEEQRLAEEQRQRAEEVRLAEERKRAEEQRIAAERKQAEDQRLAEAQRRREEAQRVAALTPLLVTLTSPRDQARVEHESIGLAGTAAGGKGVSRVSVALNGVEVSRQDERAPQRAVALSLPITLREGQNTLVVTATEADGTVSQEVRTVFYERPQPLTVAMRFPQDQMRVSDAASVAAAVVSSSKGVVRVAVTLNGVELQHQPSDKTPQRSQLVTVPLKLQPGVNVVAISATDGEGTVRQEVRTVFFDAPQSVAAPTAPPAPVPQYDRWAVVIGVGQYDHPSIPRLKYTVADAEAIYETLISVAGFKKEHVLLLTDTSDKKPTLKNIKWALGTFLARSARKDDTVLIFFAGHGAPETDPRGLERDGLAKYLIPADAEEDDLYSSALPMDELQTIFGRIESERVVAFLDACYSGAAGGRTFSARKTRAAGIDDLFLERLTRSKGRAIITASRPTEVSIELGELGHGLFTYYLINGLKGAADLNRDGIISLQELYEYLEQQVTTKSRAVGGNQHPVMKGEMEGVLPLAKVPGR